MATQSSLLTTYFQNQSMDVKNIFSEFRKPIFDNVLFTNLPILRLNSDYYDFTDNRWKQRPWVFCNDVYSEPNLFPVILLVNNIKSFLEFVPDRFPLTKSNSRVIIAPYRDTMVKILSTSK